MAARFRVLYAPRVAAQMNRAAAWWRANRPAAPDLLLEEIDAALDLVAQAPAAGRRAVLAGHRNIQRVLLRRTGYHLYYQVDFTETVVRLLAFRHGRRRLLKGE